MNKIDKALRKLTPKERGWVKDALEKLRTNETENLDLKKLRGREDVFRIRKGSVRIIYRRDTDGAMFLISIERKSDTTYNFD